MRTRSLLLAIILFAIAIIVCFTPPVQAQLKYAALSIAQTFTQLQTLAAGLAFTASTATAPSTGIKFDADTGSLDTYKGGVLAEQERGDHWIPPPCPADTSGMEYGSVCHSGGIIKYRGTLEQIP
jgi:hypothetical protein